MPDDPWTRQSVQARLAMVRAALRAAVAGRAEAELAATPMTPEWSALDLLRHLWVWDELTAGCLDDWLGDRAWVPRFDDEDRFNLEMVAARAGADLVTMLDGIDSAYDRYAATLTTCSDAELAERAATPWGAEMSRLGTIDEILRHDQHHLAQFS